MSDTSFELNAVDNQPVADGFDMVHLGAKNYDLLEKLTKEGFDKIKDSFFENSIEVDPTRWSKLYPYQFIVCRFDGASGKYTPTSLKFTLPMTPQELTINTPLAIVNTITADGVAEEHNGIKVRNISFSGSLGASPLRGRAQQFNVAEPNYAKAIFAGTIAAQQNLQQSVDDFAAGAGTNLDDFKNHIEEYAKGKVDVERTYHSTGYVQHLLLDRFLQAYAALKTTSVGKNYRLAFCMWKDNTIYLVTPVSYNLKRSASSPGEYNYDLQLKAWKRVEFNVNTLPSFVSEEAPRWTWNRSLQKLVEARNIIYNGKATINAVRGDILQLMNVVREVILATKDVTNVAMTVIDFPESVASDFANQITKNLESLSVDVSSLGDKAKKDWELLATGFSFERPHEHPDLFDNIAVDSIPVSSDLSTRARIEVGRVISYTTTDWEQRRAIVEDFMVTFANAVGAGDDSFNQNYAIAGSNVARTPTDAEYETLYAFNDILAEMDRMVYANNGGDEVASSLDFVAGLAAQSDIPFSTPASKYPVPFPYGSTLEQLAAIYLGTPDRWHEIATLNGLREPYVDEVGFAVSIVGNGDGNQISVASSENLYIDQTVWLSAPTVVRSKRHVLNIVETNGYVVLTLDGEPNLSMFSSSNGATLQAFLPDTVNSQMVIYIPSDEAPVSEETGDLPVPGDAKFDSIVNIAGVDLLLTNDNDLVITPDGDGRWAYGLTHLVQRVRTVLSTPRGSLLHHPDFGIPLEVGSSVADMSPADLKNAASTLFSEDPAFAGINNVSIVQNGPAVNIGLEMDLLGVEQPIAVSVQAFR